MLKLTSKLTSSSLLPLGKSAQLCISTPMSDVFSTGIVNGLLKSYLLIISHGVLIVKCTPTDSNISCRTKCDLDFKLFIRWN